MSVIIDENAGFCFGVVKAIAAAERHLAEQHQLYCLGDIVHNNAEVERLTRMGLKVINHQSLASLPQAKVLIRAHGEPPDTYSIAKKQDITLIDATCPIVLALQKRIREGYEEMQTVGGQVVIFGKQGHAEVKGLNGQTGNSAIIVSTPDDIGAIDFDRPIRLYSQTTKSREEYKQLQENIKARVVDKEDFFVAYNTICSRVSNRAKQLEEFAKNVDLVLFVSGENSSNGHYLFEYCSKVQPHTYMISGADTLPDVCYSDYPDIGITGATSTPRWLMEEVKKKVNELL